jgi:hypothetical protein
VKALQVTAIIASSKAAMGQYHARQFMAAVDVTRLIELHPPISPADVDCDIGLADPETVGHDQLSEEAKSKH